MRYHVLFRRMLLAVPVRLLCALPSRLLVRLKQPHVEQLESRNLPSVNPLAPAQVRQAYGFDQLGNTGAGQTIGIVEAYADPNIASDLNTFDKAFSLTPGGPSLYSQFGPSSAVLTTVAPQGPTTADASWAQETALDVEWAHAIAPAAQILLVQAQSNSIDDLLGAVDYAATHGATVVSMSWGTPEFAGETAYDSNFQQPGATYVASSGDSSVPEWPAVSPNVVGVGGTTLSVDSAGNYQSETAWSGSGGGVSAYEPKPSYQSGVTQSASQRTSPDVAYDANPNTGLWVYDSYKGGGGWGIYGGTSAGAPQWAALIALADQGRATPLSSADTLSALYTLGTGPSASTYFHDVTSGSSGANSAGPGYDLVTGLGSPVANNLVAALGGSSANVAPAKTSSSGPTPPASSGGRSIGRLTELFEAELLFSSNASKPTNIDYLSASTQSSAPIPDRPAFMTQALPPPALQRTLYWWLGDSTDLQGDDVDSDGPDVPSAAAAVPAYNMQLSVCYAETPVVERRTWGEAVGTVCDQDFFESKELYPARNDDRPVKKPVAQQKPRSLAAGFLMAGAAVAFGTPRHSAGKQLTDDAWHYWRKWCRVPFRAQPRP